MTEELLVFKLLGAAKSYTSTNLGKWLGEFRQFYLFPFYLAFAILLISFSNTQLV